MKTKYCAKPKALETGFTIIEMLIALLILSFGLLTAGQLIFVAMSSSSLARSKGNAALLAQDKLEFLADLYRRNPDATELSVGSHGAEQVQFLSSTGTILNRFSVSWNVSAIPDPRGGADLHAKLVRVTVVPVGVDGLDNRRVLLNKIVSVSSIISPGVQ